MQRAYLLRLAEGLGQSRTILWHLYGQDRSVVRPLASFTQLARLALGLRGRSLGTEVMQYLRFLSQDATKREFRQASWRGVQRAREIIASSGVPAEAGKGAE